MRTLIRRRFFAQNLSTTHKPMQSDKTEELFKETLYLKKSDNICRHRLTLNSSKRPTRSFLMHNYLWSVL